MVPLLATAYLPPIEHFAFFTEEEIWVERCEHFQKQSYRTRAVILTATGPQNLSVPVVHNSEKELIGQTRLDYATPWQRTHWRTLETAYGSSPYFLYYEDLLRPFYETRYEYLFDYNMALTKTLLKIMHLQPNIRCTEEFAPVRRHDLRTLLQPKRRSIETYPFRLQPYYQVFENRFGFVPYLSIVDLLFNVGPGTTAYLRQTLLQYQSQTDLL